MTLQPNHNEADSRLTILFACIHNSGRSVAAKVIAEHLTQGQAVILSGGSEPKDSINKNIAEALQKRGLSIEKEYPKALTPEMVQESDIVITMGCGETCPIFPGKKYLDWQIGDPADKDLATAEKVVDEIWNKVSDLLKELDISVAGSR